MDLLCVHRCIPLHPTAAPNSSHCPDGLQHELARMAPENNRWVFTGNCCFFCSNQITRTFLFFFPVCVSPPVFATCIFLNICNFLEHVSSHVFLHKYMMCAKHVHVWNSRKMHLPTPTEICCPCPCEVVGSAPADCLCCTVAKKPKVVTQP